MAINEKRMLPRRMRTMYQMEELLQAEQIILDIIIKVMEEIEESLEEIREETLTVERLISIAQILSRTSCVVEEYPENVKIRLIFEQLVGFHSRIQRKLLDLIPAHLEVVFAYKVDMTFVLTEKMKLMGVRNRMDMYEWNSSKVQTVRIRFEARINKREIFGSAQMIIRKNLWFLDGSKNLDGEYLLNAKEYKEEI